MGKFKRIMLSRNTIITLTVLTVFAMVTTVVFAEKLDKREIFIYKGGSERGYLGVGIVKIPSVEKKELAVKFGVKVISVKDKSAADKSGVKIGDVIQYFNKEKIRVPNDLINIVRDTKPGVKSVLKIIRNKKNKKFVLKLDDHRSQYKLKRINSKRAFLGVHLEDMNDDFGTYFGVENGEGALIKKVSADTPAEEADFKAGDVIIKIENNVIKSSKDVTKALSKFKKGDKVNIVFLRHKKKKSVKVELDEKSRFGNFHFKFDGLMPLKELKGMKHLKNLNIRLHELRGKLHHFDDIEIIVDEDHEKKMIIKRKIKKIKEKKEILKKKASKEKHERL